MPEPNDPPAWTPPWPRWLNLSWLGGIEPWVRLLTRLVVGVFLVWSVWDEVTQAPAMQALADALAGDGAPWAGLAARISVYTQMACGLAFIAGLVTRWAGVICAILFTVTAAYALGDSIESAMPAVLLALIGLDMLARGPGRYNLRTLLVGR
ncbi:MAG: DoxX family protein [Phenylobacterium sp.]|nr:DoxX family protein [Phenylobacterium sp.]